MKITLLLVALTGCALAGKAAICADKGANGGIKVLVQPKVDNIFELGDRVKLECIAHGYPAPYVSWTKGIGKNKVNLGVVGIGSATLFFPKLKKDQIGFYSCVIEDCCSNDKIEIGTEVSTDKGPDCGKKWGDEGDITVFGMKYEYRNWTSAMEYCESQGLTMAMAHSAEENAQLLSDIKKSFGRDPNAVKYSHENYVWLAAHDCCGVDQEGQFMNALDNTPLEYVNWQSDQPDNWHGPKGQDKEGQDACGMNRGTGKWDDSFYKHVRPFACKCPAHMKK